MPHLKRPICRRQFRSPSTTILLCRRSRLLPTEPSNCACRAICCTRPLTPGNRRGSLRNPARRATGAGRRAEISVGMDQDRPGNLDCVTLYFRIPAREFCPGIRYQASPCYSPATGHRQHWSFELRLGGGLGSRDEAHS